MPLSMQVADNQDGSGAVVTVSGSDAGSTNRLWLTPINGNMGLLEPVEVASRTGDGTIPVNTGTGLYHWEIRSSGSGSPIAAWLQSTTNANAKSVLDRTLDLFVDRIRLLNLVGVQNINIVRQWFPRYLKEANGLPRVCVVPVDGETFPGVLTGRDDIGYPILIAMISQAEGSVTLNQSRNMLWRERVSKAFRMQRLPGLPESLIVKPEKGIIIDPTVFDQAQYHLSWLMFRSIARESRGLT